MITRAATVLGLILLFAPASSAQAPAPGRLAHTFAAPGWAGGTVSLHLGGGIEALVTPGMGAGVELGYVGPFPDGFGRGLGLLSANLTAHLPSATPRRLTPFLTGGYTLAFRSGVAHLLNAGGGVQYRVNDGLAVRIELRDHPVPARRSYAPHLLGLRMSATWSM